jgi:putative Holliday junction resolvase
MWAGMPDSAGPVVPQGVILGFDFGLRRIGVAVGQTTTRTGSPLAMVGHGDAPDWNALDSLVKEWKPAVLVVGLPLDGEGNETDMSRAARRFGQALSERSGIPVQYADERLTSHAAEADFAVRRASGRARRKDAARLDAVAARIILENWLQSLPQ